MAPTTAAELEGMTYREIQSLCKEAGVKASGKKNELVARLLSAVSQHAPEAAVGPGVPAPIEEQEPEQAEEQPQPQQEEEDEEAAEEAAPPSQMAVAAAPTPAEPEPEPEPAADAGKRKAEAEAAEAPSLKHLKSPGVMLTRRPLPTSGIKPPSIVASKPVPSPILFPQAAAAAAAAATTKPAAPGSARKSVACATTSSHRASILTKKAIATAPTPFGPGTYKAKTAAAPIAATASAKAALLKERPKLSYKPHTGPLRPFFSPKPFLAKPQANGQQQQQQRKPLGAMGNVNNRAGSILGAGIGKPGGGAVVVKPAAASTSMQQSQAPPAAKQVL